MSLPIGLILHAGNDSDHKDHVHVEGVPKKFGTPPLTNPGKSPAIQAIYNALVVEFGPGCYFATNPRPTNCKWTNMGGYNRRPINDSNSPGSTVWSQHAYWNALDIGPYLGVAAQKPYLDFLLANKGGVVPPDNGDEMAAMQVEDVQEALNAAGYVGTLGKPLTVDGDFGPNSRFAYQNMMKDAKKTGSPGVTLAAMNSAIAAHAKVKSSATVHPHTHATPAGKTGNPV